MTNTAIVTSPGSYVEWSAIIAGTVLACAITVVLLQFGQALGFTMASIDLDDSNIAGRFMTIGLWALWVQLLSASAGGYLAGRMRQPWSNATESESEIRDGVHGLLSWAVSTLLVVIAVGAIGYIAAIAAHAGVDTAEPNEASQAMARKLGIIIGFSMFATSVVSGVAAWFTGTLGGDHRDKAVDVSRYISFRTKSGKKVVHKA